MNKKILIILILVALVVIGLVIYFFENKREAMKMPKQKLTECLEDDEKAIYEIKKRENRVSMVDIIISDKNNNQEKYRFQIELPIPDHYHPLELHKCGIYAVKSFGYDYSTRTSQPGYKAEIRKYDYKGNGESVVLIAEDTLGGLKGYKYFFSTDFRIDFQERYLVLIKNYSNKDDYSLVIKDLNTKEDKFILFAKDIVKQYPNVVGSFGFDKWTDDGRYFWGDVFDGAYSLAYFRIDTNNWSYDIFEAPDGSMGGMPLNINTGYLPIQPGLVWAGDVELTQELKEKDRKNGKKSILYLYSLFTKEQKLLETTDEPQFFFKPQWLSDTGLQYELPSGEKKIYRIEK